MKKIEKPKSEDALCDLVKNAIGNKQTLKIIGGGTRPIGNAVVADSVINTSAIKGVSIFEPGALTLVANAGTSLDEIQKLLATENQHLPFEPADYRGLLGTKGNSTIGGVVAGGVSGPRRIQVGAMRDTLIGVRFVNGEGVAIKNGGRVMKNVTGYDLVKLMAGSHGTLGILTEVAFKVLPMVEKSNTLLVRGLSDVDATIVMSKALGSPYDIAGAAHTPAQNTKNSYAVTSIRVEGFEKSVAYRLSQLKEIIAQEMGSSIIIDVETNAKKSSDIWKSIRDVTPFHNAKGAVWKISVKPTDGAKVVNALSAIMQVKSMYDWGGGLVWLLVEEDTITNAEIVRKTVGNVKGHATLMRAENDTVLKIEAFHPQAKRLAKLSNQLRTQFDPHGIFNPQLMEKPSTRTMLEAG